ncbi:TIGR04372 family glycosyltransferase [Polynucleobacter paneuropaeus]|nr:TIGR04372 family glycosyltransferase [Polynucleobacter paneuropaeus]
MNTKVVNFFKKIVRIIRVIYRYLVERPIYLFNELTIESKIGDLKEKVVALVPSDAIGPMIQFSEYFIRYCKLKNLDLNRDVIFICKSVNANTYFLDILRSKVELKVDDRLYEKIYKGGYRGLLKKDLYIPDDVPKNIRNGMIFYPDAPTRYEFSRGDIRRGWGLLAEIGIAEGDRFITIHNKDQSYWGAERGINKPHDVYRNSKFSTLKDAINYLKQSGYKVIRVGHYSDDSPNCLSIMDFKKQEKEFLDFFIHKFCQFSICGNSGVALIPWVFQKNILYHNFIPMGESPVIERGLVVPKLLLNSSGKVLSLKEIFAIRHNIFYNERGRIYFRSLTADYFQDINQYTKCGLLIQDNTTNEILTGVRELQKYFVDAVRLTPAQVKMQQRFKELFPMHHPMRRSPNCIVSPDFLERNEFILY